MFAAGTRSVCSPASDPQALVAAGIIVHTSYRLLKLGSASGQRGRYQRGRRPEWPARISSTLTKSLHSTMTGGIRLNAVAWPES